MKNILIKEFNIENKDKISLLISNNTDIESIEDYIDSIIKNSRFSLFEIILEDEIIGYYQIHKLQNIGIDIVIDKLYFTKDLYIFKFVLENIINEFDNSTMMYRLDKKEFYKFNLLTKNKFQEYKQDNAAILMLRN